MRKTHLRAGILLALISLWCLVGWIPNATSPPSSELDLAPSLIPTIAVSVCLLMSIALAAGAYLMPVEDTGLDDEFGAEATGVDGSVMANFGIWCVVAVVIWLLMTHVGFEPAMSVFLFTTFLYLRVRNLWVLGLASVLVPIVISQIVWFSFSTVLPGFWR